MKYHNMCAILAAHLCFASGHTVAEIARSAGKSKRTIYRWLATMPEHQRRWARKRNAEMRHKAEGWPWP